MPLHSQDGKRLSSKWLASQSKVATQRKTKNKILFQIKSTPSKTTMDRSTVVTWVWSTNTKSGSSGRPSQTCLKLRKMLKKLRLSLLAAICKSVPSANGLKGCARLSSRVTVLPNSRWLHTISTKRPCSVSGDAILLRRRAFAWGYLTWLPNLTILANSRDSRWFKISK